jgi:DNA-directed RNA polymerase specialized sigma24 family protein
MDMNDYAIAVLARDRLAEMRAAGERWSRIRIAKPRSRPLRVALAICSYGWGDACTVAGDVRCWHPVSVTQSRLPGSRRLRSSVGDLDADLVKAQRWSDADGPEQLLDRHGDRIYRLALRIIGVEEDAAQAVEETILTATRTIHALGGKPALGSWIYQTAAKAAYQRLRARRPPVEEIALDDVLPRLDGDGRHFESMDDWSSRMPQGALQGALRGIMIGAVDALPAD